MAINIYDPEVYGGGGGGYLPPDGMYRIERARGEFYNFNNQAPGKSGKGIPSLHLNLQGLDKDGRDVGEAHSIFYGGTDDLEILEGGKRFDFSSDAKGETIWDKCDFGFFMTNLLKNARGFNPEPFMQSDGDISLLDGMVAEFTATASPRTQTKQKINPKTGKPYPAPLVLVVTNVPKGQPARSSKPAAKEEAASSNGAGSGASDEVLEVLAEYLEKEVCAGDSGDFNKLKARMGIKSFGPLKKDGDTAKAVASAFNSAIGDGSIGKYLPKGWKYDAGEDAFVKK